LRKLPTPKHRSKAVAPQHGGSRLVSDASELLTDASTQQHHWTLRLFVDR
jgi:hypothetical protein